MHVGRVGRVTGFASLHLLTHTACAHQGAPTLKKDDVSGRKTLVEKPVLGMQCRMCRVINWQAKHMSDIVAAILQLSLGGEASKKIWTSQTLLLIQPDLSVILLIDH